MNSQRNASSGDWVVSHGSRKGGIKKWGCISQRTTKVTCWLNDNRIKVPTLGWVRFKEKGYISTNAKVKSCTLTQQADRFYVSVIVDVILRWLIRLIPRALGWTLVSNTSPRSAMAKNSGTSTNLPLLNEWRSASSGRNGHFPANSNPE
jgi:hypothetical protein